MAVQDEEVERWLQQLKSEQPQGMDQQIEDPYTNRATPQILGPVVDTLSSVRGTVETELNSTNDNPLIVVERGESYHNANFHGQYIANAMDQLSIVLTTMSNLSDRRTDRLLDPGHNHGLPPFLCRENPGLRHGMMGGQYAATSLTAENRSLGPLLPLEVSFFSVYLPGHFYRLLYYYFKFYRYRPSVSTHRAAARPRDTPALPTP